MGAGGSAPDTARSGSRDALFDLAVERALTYVTRARVPASDDPGALRRALEVWYLKTRFVARVPLDEVVAALAARPADGGAWRWRGGRSGAWVPYREGRAP
jgi:hypothetical protein